VKHVSLMLVVLVASGCGQQSRVSQCSPSATQPDLQPITVTFAAVAVEVELLLPPAVFCQDGNPVATRVETEVLDGANAALAHTKGAMSSSDTRGYATTIGFVPPAPGVYYLTARFEPSLGVARRQVHALKDRTAELAAVQAPAPALCDEVAGLEAGALCRRGGELSLVRPDAGAVVASGVSGVQSVGGAAWWWTATTLSRAVDDGDGGLAVESLPFRVAAPLGVERDRFTSTGSGELLEVSPALDGGLAVSSRALPAGAVPIGPGLSRRGESVGYATATELCVLGLASDDASVPVRCVPAAGLTPAMGEGDVLWLRGVETGVLAQARVVNATRDLEVRFLPAQSPLMVDTKQGVPAFTWAGHFLAVRADLTLDAWLPPAGVARRSVTPDFVVFQTREQLLLYRR
jgi:hypothetical protein